MDVPEPFKRLWRWWGHADTLRGLLEVIWIIWRLLSGLGGLAILVVFMGLLIGWISEYAALIVTGAALLVSMVPFLLWIFDVNGFRTLHREVPQAQVVQPDPIRTEVNVPEPTVIRHAPTFRQRTAEAWRQVQNFFKPIPKQGVTQSTFPPPPDYKRIEADVRASIDKIVGEFTQVLEQGEAIQDMATDEGVDIAKVRAAASEWRNRLRTSVTDHFLGAKAIYVDTDYSGVAMIMVAHKGKGVSGERRTILLDIGERLQRLREILKEL